MLQDRVTRIVHCDWGTHPTKRRMASASLDVQGGWCVDAVTDAGELATLLARAGRGLDPSAGAVLVGFDFPIGVPRAYAAVVGVDAFVPFLAGLGEGKWSRFFEVCERADEIGVHRPFYPWSGGTKGSTSRAHLKEALGLEHHDLLRRCDRLSGAETMFWTLGAKQVGKGALAGWREVLAPSLGRVRLWPFEGRLEELLTPGAIVVAETYPAELYRHLGIEDVVKSDAAARAVAGARLAAWAAARSIQLDPTLAADLTTGFANDDDFDAFVGALGMINVVRGERQEGAPAAEDRDVEGWILGLG